MRVAILEILALPESRPDRLFYNFILKKQYASIMPQAVAAWCRRAGHEVVYGTYWGVGDPARVIPLGEADVAFISSYTLNSPLAYVIGKALRRRGVRTVLGGPHAKAFGRDSARFFDHVVGECDEALVLSILAGEAPLGVISSKRPPRAFPTVEERLPEIKIASLLFGRWRSPTTTVGILSSIGCPYTCSFCPDGRSTYETMSEPQLVEDLRAIRRHIPRALVAYHDPNFGIRFDQTMRAIEQQDEPLPYMMESSLKILRSDRIARLRDTNCVYIAPGVESFADFSNKSGGASRVGAAKLAAVVAQFRELYDAIPRVHLQANFILGVDADVGDEPFDLLHQFMDQAPFVWPSINIPVPYGGTDLTDDWRRDGRVLEAMPLLFYYAPHSVVRIKNYDPIDYYRRLIALFEHLASPAAYARRQEMARVRTERAINLAQTLFARSEMASYRRVLHALSTDRAMLDFHAGRTSRVPDFYRAEYARSLGHLAGHLTDDERRPVLDQAAPLAA